MLEEDSWIEDRFLEDGADGVLSRQENPFNIYVNEPDNFDHVPDNFNYEKPFHTNSNQIDRDEMKEFVHVALKGQANVIRQVNLKKENLNKMILKHSYELKEKQSLLQIEMEKVKIKNEYLDKQIEYTKKERESIISLHRTFQKERDDMIQKMESLKDILKAVEYKIISLYNSLQEIK